MCAEGKASRFRPLTDAERHVGNRLAYIRRHHNHPQKELAHRLDLTVNQITNIESGRVSLKAYKGWQACKLYGLQPRWLAAGAPPEGPFPDLGEEFTAWADSYFKSIGRLTFFDAWCKIGWLFQESPEVEKARRQMMKSIPKAEGQEYQIKIGQNKPLTLITLSSNSPDVHSEMDSLLKRLRRVTSAPGMKSALAKYLKVAPPRISEWLREDEPKSPGGETTLRLLRWVEKQEQLQNKTA